MSLTIQDVKTVQPSKNNNGNNGISNGANHQKASASAEVQKQLISFQGAQALKARMIVPSFRGADTSTDLPYRKEKDQIVNFIKESVKGCIVIPSICVKSSLYSFILIIFFVYFF